MSADKPSKSEAEYFTKRDRELIRQKRQALKTEARETERRQHYQKCCKCGADLVEEEFHGVTIDRCPECNGIWLDAGEIERLMADHEPGLLGRVFGDLTAVLREPKQD